MLKGSLRVGIYKKGVYILRGRHGLSLFAPPALIIMRGGDYNDIYRSIHKCCSVDNISIEFTVYFKESVTRKG